MKKNKRPAGFAGLFDLIFQVLSDLDFYIYSTWKLDFHQCIDSLR